MRVKLYIPYDDATFLDFNESDIYNVEGSYEQALLKELQNGDDVFNAMFGDGDIKPIQQMPQNTVKNAPQSFISCEVDIYNEEYKDETVGSLIQYAVEQDIVMMLMKFDFSTMGEEFETDFRMWVDNHNSINKQRFDNDWKFKNEPTRTFKMEFPNLKNELTYLELSNCKLIEPYGSNGFIVLVEKINFDKGIE